MARTLNKRCRGPHQCKQRTQLEGGTRTRDAQVYPEKLRQAFVDGILIQKEIDARGLGLIIAAGYNGFLCHLGMATTPGTDGRRQAKASDGSAGWNGLAAPKEE